MKGKKPVVVYHCTAANHYSWEKSWFMTKKALLNHFWTRHIITGVLKE